MADLNEILERPEPALGPPEGEPRALDGGITNRNFQVRMGGCDYVIRQPGSHTALLGIDREAERLANAIAAQLGIAPAVAAKLDDCLVTRYVACTPPRAGEPVIAPRSSHGRCTASTTHVHACRAASGCPICWTTTRPSWPGTAASFRAPRRGAGDRRTRGGGRATHGRQPLP